MSRTKQITLYSFSELSESAKERARDRYRQHYLDYEWWESTYEDAARIGLKIKSFDVDRGDVKAELTESVGEVCRRIIADHGKECRTYKTALQFFSSKRLDKGVGNEAYPGEFCYSLAQDYLFILRDEYEYQMSDECIDEMLVENEYEFYEDGRLAV